ncbi:uncharacterized protein LOC127288091 isoform X2 [Leptopilina boulardi]|uniref:uncharacterized protein LOC127288091 isoform X2 n=1 Tax=Leptopilina boulardi TaxID=63433 RepID=UPI0021F5A3E1|nr:uncharacterized protein LOC127288091 isoform X2 [Leptopilina boulardi]
MATMEEIIPDNFNDEFDENIIAGLLGTKELLRKDFCTRRLEIRLNKYVKIKDPTTTSEAGAKTDNDSLKKFNKTLEKHLKLLQLESEKENLDTNAVKKLLDITRDDRKNYTKTCSAGELLQRYPVLQKNQIFLWEFGQLINLSPDIMKKNLLYAIPKLLTLYPLSEKETNSNIFFLKQLNFLFSSGRKRAKRPKRQLVEIRKLDDKNASKALKKKRAPFFRFSDDNAEKVMCYVDGEQFFVEEPIDSIIILLATYWVFYIDFDKGFKDQLILLCFITFGTRLAERILRAFDIQSSTVDDILLRAKLL